MTTPSRDELRTQYFDLMRRANEIGVQIPRPEDFDVSDAQAVASVKVLLREHSKVLAQLGRLTKKINKLFPHH